MATNRQPDDNRGGRSSYHPALYLEGSNKREIGKKFKLHESTIGKILGDLQKGIYSQIQVPDPPQIGDVWFFATCD